MAKKHKPTPEQRALIKRLAESPFLKKLGKDLRKAADEAAELERKRKVLDRAQAIRDGLVQPPWMKTKAKSKSRNDEGWQERRVKPILLELWPPTGRPPSGLTQKEVVAKVNERFQRLYGCKVSRSTIYRVIKSSSSPLAGPPCPNCPRTFEHVHHFCQCVYMLILTVF